MQKRRGQSKRLNYLPCGCNYQLYYSALSTNELLEAVHSCLILMLPICGGRVTSIKIFSNIFCKVYNVQ